MISIKRNACIYCGSCVAVCAHGALRMREVFVEISRARCVSCGVCARACPMNAITVESKK